jgi:DNA-binding SARP family transcriptional activator
MRFSILGPLLAEADDGTPLVLGRPSQRATLAVLLLHAAQPASKNLLIEALWGDNPPGDAETALRVRMRDVRRGLAGHHRLETRPAGYQFVVKPGELDADTFRALIGHGRAALDSGNAEDSARLLEQACRLWREPPLADVPDTPLMRTVATALLEQWRNAREWLIDARLGLGQHQEVLSQLRGAIAADPLPEHPHVQLMLALYRCGQKAAALDVYSRLRDLTAREFGQDPGPEAREMLSQILSDGPALQFRPRPLAVTSHGPMPAWTPLCQLPAPPPDFTGRVLAFEALAAQIPGNSMTVTVITGPPGAGKTALAVQAAHVVSSAFPDGQLYVSLGGRSRPREPLDVLGELLRSVGVPPAKVPAALAERAALYRSMLAGRRVLVLADDAATSAQVRPLLPGTPTSAVLVTSSSRLADLEGARSVGVAVLSPHEALALLGKIVGRDRVAAERDSADAIIAACGGLPLGLRIAGARLAGSPGLRLGDLAAALAAPRRVLAELAIGDLSVRGRLDLAWQALDADSQRALRLLALAGLADLPDWLVLEAARGSAAVIEALADCWLILQDPHSARYHLAPLAGCYAAERPDPLPDAQPPYAEERLLRHWLELADHASAQLSPAAWPRPGRVRTEFLRPEAAARIAGDGRAWLSRERDNLLAATAQASALGLHDLAADLADRQLAQQCAAGYTDEAELLWCGIGDAALRDGAARAGNDRHQARPADGAWAGRHGNARRARDPSAIRASQSPA